MIKKYNKMTEDRKKEVEAIISEYCESNIAYEALMTSIVKAKLVLDELEKERLALSGTINEIRSRENDLFERVKEEDGSDEQFRLEIAEMVKK